MIAKTYILSDAVPDRVALCVDDVARRLRIRLVARPPQVTGSLKIWPWVETDTGATIAQLAYDHEFAAWHLGLDARDRPIAEPELDALVNAHLTVVPREALAERGLELGAPAKRLALAALANAHDMPAALTQRIGALLRSADRAEVQRGLLAAGLAPSEAFLPALVAAGERFGTDEAIATGVGMLIQTILSGTEA
jgi:hypothetical protein